LENVHGESVPNITHWIRGEESLLLEKPRIAKMALLGLGGSIATPANGLTAQVFVVSSFDDLTKNCSKAKGKIVVFNGEIEIDRKKKQRN
jgi:carboxypeptidase Q